MRNKILDELIDISRAIIKLLENAAAIKILKLGSLQHEHRLCNLLIYNKTFLKHERKDERLLKYYATTVEIFTARIES